jgi:GAF domain-containing protein
VTRLRTALTLADLSSIADLTASAPGPDDVFRAVEALAQRTIGHRLFTVMRLHIASAEVERVYSSRPDAYPVSGRKPKGGTPWGAQVLDRGEVFFARTPAEVERAFADHALIFSLGIGAIMNVPIRFRGRSLGTLNLCHEANWFEDADAAPGRLLAALLVPSLLAGE